MISADKYAVAIHEAGHAIARHRLGYDFTAVTIEPDRWNGTLGHLSVWPDGDHYSADELESYEDSYDSIYGWTKGTIDDEADDDVDEETREYRCLRRQYAQQYETQADHANIISLAGPLAEAWHLRCTLSKILEGGGSRDYEYICDRGGLTSELKRKTAGLISNEWRKILLVASALMERTTLSYQDFLEVIFETNWVAEDVALGIRSAPPGNKAAWP